MKQLKTLHFPNEAEPREIVDAYARERIENLTASSDAPVLDVTLDANGIMTYNNSPAFDEWLTETEGSEKFAPAGYGYGEALPTVTGTTDAEFLANIEALCAEKINFSTFQAVISPHGDMFDGYSFIAQIWHNTVESNGTRYIKIKAHGIANTWTFQRVCYANTWEDYEWVNPPMILGTEYRTTERWHGYPVYRKVIIFGALPNNTYKSVTYHDGAWGTVVPLLATGRTSGGQIFPTNNYSGSSGAINLKVDNNTITVHTNLDLSAKTGYVDVRYIYL